MKHRKKVLAAAALAIAGTILLTASSCSEADNRDAQYSALDKKSDARAAPDVTGDTEYNNYMKAQKLYDDKASIIWCTATWSNSTAPIFTVPIAGKLTSSSVSYYPNQQVDYDSNGNVLIERKSVDGMYHGTPPPYRYGFTPGGQYVDFTGMETFCTTQLTSFQKQSIQVASVDTAADAVTQKAETLLKAGDAAGAQKLLDGITK